MPARPNMIGLSQPHEPWKLGWLPYHLHLLPSLPTLYLYFACCAASFATPTSGAFFSNTLFLLNCSEPLPRIASQYSTYRQIHVRSTLRTAVNRKDYPQPSNVTVPIVVGPFNQRVLTLSVPHTAPPRPTIFIDKRATPLSLQTYKTKYTPWSQSRWRLHKTTTHSQRHPGSGISGSNNNSLPTSPRKTRNGRLTRPGNQGGLVSGRITAREARTIKISSLRPIARKRPSGCTPRPTRPWRSMKSSPV